MPKEKFHNIYQDLKTKIEAGEYHVSDMLPSEHALVEIYGCSRNTIRRAIRCLVTEGYVQAVHGKGVQVLYAPSNQAEFTIGGIESFAESAVRNNRKPGTKVITFTELLVDESMSRRTGFAAGSPVYYIERVRYLDEQPLILDINIFLKSEAEGLTKEIAKNSIYQYLEHTLGMQITTSRRAITAERATLADKKHLDLQEYDFVCVVTGRTYNSKGILFEYTQSRHRPDYFRFEDTAVRERRR